MGPFAEVNNIGKKRNPYSERKMLSISDIEGLRFRKNEKTGSASVCILRSEEEKMGQVIRTQQKTLYQCRQHDPRKTWKKEKLALGIEMVGNCLKFKS